MPLHQICCISANTARALSRALLKLICGELFYQCFAAAHPDVTAETVEGRKSNSMFCLNMTTGR